MSEQSGKQVEHPVDQLIGTAGGSAPPIKDTTTQTFMADVVEASMQNPVVVDFWAPWCGPCKQLGPILEKAVKATNGSVRMVKLNIDDNPEIAQQMRIQSIPAVYAFKDGRPVDGFVGAVPESQVKAFVARLASGTAPSPIDEALEIAKQAIAENDFEAARNIYQQVLQHQPENVAAAVGLARCALAANDLDTATALVAQIPESEAKNPDLVSVKAALELAAAAASASGATREYELRLERDPADHEARLELANALFATGGRQEAIDHLLHIIRADREWNEQAARKQLLKLFDAMGAMDPLTVQARKRLSSLLFS